MVLKNKILKNMVVTNMVSQACGLNKHGLDKHGLDKHGLDKHGFDIVLISVWIYLPAVLDWLSILFNWLVVNLEREPF